MLMNKGAEAELHLRHWHGLKSVMKVRKTKPYRVRQLDLKIRRSRTAREAQLIHDAKAAGVPTPFIRLIDLKETTLIMQHIEGRRLKDLLNSLPIEKKFSLCWQCGKLIARLHKNGIIHGDLTTSNMIVTEKKTIYFLDFGLAEYSRELEKQGVDLLLMRRSLQATHYRYAKDCFSAVTQGYLTVMGKKATYEIIKRVEEIARRGRYSTGR
jgi:TP53 regulating kinase-like protein